MMGSGCSSSDRVIAVMVVVVVLLIAVATAGDFMVEISHGCRQALVYPDEQ